MNALEKTFPATNSNQAKEPCPLLAASDNIAILLAQVSRLIRKSFDTRVRQIGLTRPQWQALTLLTRHEGVNQRGMAEILEVEPITLGRMIARLLESGLVERRREPGNRRSWCLYLTTKGRELASNLKPIADEALDEALVGVDPAELAILSRLLFKIRDNLSRK